MQQTNSIFKNLAFMLQLATFCMLLILSAKAYVGTKSELSGNTARVAMHMIATAGTVTEQDLLKPFSALFNQKQTGKFKFWQSLQTRHVWLCEATGAGMWGNITAVILLDINTWHILAFKVIAQNETAGLGAQIADEEFSAKFEGIYCRDKIQLTKIKITNNQFDAITGATQSSKAVEKLINNALDSLQSRLGVQNEEL